MRQSIILAVEVEFLHDLRLRQKEGESSTREKEKNE
jgi:hypothetical protein